MMIVGAVVILFVIALFFSMLGQQPKIDHEWQNDTDSELFATPVAKTSSLDTPVEEPVTVSHAWLQ